MALPIEMEWVPGEPVEEKEDIPGSGHSVTDPRADLANYGDSK
jgi:hypothetical protein